MSHRKEIVIPPAVEPVTLAQAKVHLRVDIPDDDLLITSLITAARELCEVHTTKSFITTTFDQYEDALPQGGGYWNRDIRRQGPDPTDPHWLPSWTAPVSLLRAPLQAIVSFTYLDTQGAQQILDPAILRVSLGSPGRVQPIYGRSWPFVYPTNDAVVIRFTAGYGADPTAVPESIKAAILLEVGNLYENREAVLAGIIPAVLPLGVQSLLGINDHGGGYG